MQSFRFSRLGSISCSVPSLKNSNSSSKHPEQVKYPASKSLSTILFFLNLPDCSVHVLLETQGDHQSSARNNVPFYVKKDHELISVGAFTSTQLKLLTSDSSPEGAFSVGEWWASRSNAAFAAEKWCPRPEPGSSDGGLFLKLPWQLPSCSFPGRAALLSMWVCFFPPPIAAVSTCTRALLLLSPASRGGRGGRFACSYRRRALTLSPTLTLL